MVMAFGYTYDDVGNITQETRDGANTTYVYDHLGQLIRVNDPNDKTSGSSGTTWVYYYDCGGNILQKKRCPYTVGTPTESQAVTTPYEYGDQDAAWKDQMTAYNGYEITYDGIGNPIEYDGWQYIWQAGRQLAEIKKPDNSRKITFTYNHDGLRTQKIETVGNTVTTTEYLLHGKLVTGLKQGSKELHFFSNRSRRNLRFSVRRMLRMLCFASQNRLHTVFYAVLRTVIKTACGTF